MFVPAKYKDCYLAYILTELAGATAMIFTRTCDGTRRIALTLVSALGTDDKQCCWRVTLPWRAARSGSAQQSAPSFCRTIFRLLLLFCMFSANPPEAHASGPPLSVAVACCPLLSSPRLDGDCCPVT